MLNCVETESFFSWRFWSCKISSGPVNILSYMYKPCSLVEFYPKCEPCTHVLVNLWLPFRLMFSLCPIQTTICQINFKYVTSSFDSFTYSPGPNAFQVTIKPTHKINEIACSKLIIKTILHVKLCRNWKLFLVKILVL